MDGSYWLVWGWFNVNIGVQASLGGGGGGSAQ